MTQGTGCLFTFAKRGKRDMGAPEPVVEVFAEPTIVGHCFKVAVGGADQADISVPQFGFADAVVFSFIKYAQEFALESKRQVADFSSRNSVPPLVTLKSPCLVFVAPVKAPCAWPKSSDSMRLGVRPAQLSQ